jgi:DNA-binding LytR/AlgR family response regulator
VPVLLTSGYAEAAIHEAEAAGIQILEKPYQIEELAAALDAARSSRQIEADVRLSTSG